MGEEQGGEDRGVGGLRLGEVGAACAAKPPSAGAEGHAACGVGEP